MYAKYIKRMLDCIISFFAILLLLPLLIMLSVVGAAVMKGNPFFVQPRAGKINNKTGKEKIFNLYKFRTMSNAKDNNGNLLPDDVRLNSYGKILRATSLDELPEFFNILKGDMSIVGPRPLLVSYIERYSEEQRHRHDALPGLTGYAQVHGRNRVSWEDRFAMDVWYVKHISFKFDVKIITDTVKVVILREGISSEKSVTMEEFMGSDNEKSSWVAPL